jgi:ABC-type transport system involved in multi-copper enzyme maturation permease subunit
MPSSRAWVQKELLQILRGRQLVFFLLMEILLAFVLFLLAARQWERQVESTRVVEETNQRRVATTTSWRGLGEVGILVPAPTPAGRFLVSASSWPAFLVKVPELPTPLGGWSEAVFPSPAEVLLFFYSLFALLLSFDTVVLEKSQRTLGLLLTAVGSRRKLLEVKFLVRAGVVGAVALLSLSVAALATAVLKPEFVGGTGFWKAWLAVTVFLVALSVVFVAVGLAISCVFPEPLTALLAGVGSWVLLVIGLPGAGEALARALVPPPSRTFFEAQAESLYARHEQRFLEALVEPMRRWLKGGPGLQEWFEGERKRIGAELGAELQRELSTLFSGYLGAERRSAEAMRWMVGWLPTGLCQEALAALGGADTESFLRYLQEVTDYGQRFGELVARKQTFVQSVLPFDDDPFALSRPNIEEVPKFRHEPAPATWSSQLPRLMGLLVWTGVGYVVATLSFRRVDPR